MTDPTHNAASSGVSVATALTLPTSGKDIRVSFHGVPELHLEFDPTCALFDRVSNDLVIENEGQSSGKLILEGFFAQERLPDLVLPDGDVVPGRDFLEAMHFKELSPESGTLELGFLDSGFPPLPCGDACPATRADALAAHGSEEAHLALLIQQGLV